MKLRPGDIVESRNHIHVYVGHSKTCGHLLKISKKNYLVLRVLSKKKNGWNPPGAYMWVDTEKELVKLTKKQIQNLQMDLL